MKKERALFIVSCIVAAFVYTTMHINVYRYPVSGAFFEIIWLPVLALVFILPVLSLIGWIKAKFSLRLLYVYSLIVNTGLLIFLFFLNKK